MANQSTGETRVTADGEPFQRLSAAAARGMIEQGGVQVVDVRRPDEWAQGHIAEAVLIPVDALLGRKDELRPEGAVIMVCKVGIRSALAAEMAAAVGCRQVYNLEGGMEEWVKQGYPTVK